MSQESWDERYSASQQVWSGRPSRWLVEAAAELSPGSAADLGCGEGADAIWLAAHGWSVTAVDFSAPGLARARREAHRAGVPVVWLRQDLTAWQPAEPFDLVSVQYLHAPRQDRREAHRRAWAATRGTLVIVGHAPGHPGGPAAEAKYDPAEVLDSLHVEPGDPRVDVAVERTRGDARDTVVILRR